MNEQEPKRENGTQNRDVRAETVLENLIELDRILTEGSRQELTGMPYVELSKHVRIRHEAD